MIISHKHKLVFIKTRKTAGTSVEIALSAICGNDDVITPLGPADEAHRKLHKGCGPQNTIIPTARYTKEDWLKTLVTGRRRRYTEHQDAASVREYLGRTNWEKYYSISIERNPWDKTVSFYWWCGGDEKFGSIRSFLENCYYLPQNFDLYSKGGRILVDKVLKFEQLDEELVSLSEQLGLSDPLTIKDIRAKSSQRKDPRHYREVLDPQSAEIIRKVYIREIEHFGYTY